MIVGVDASRNRSGGALAHLKGILTAADPLQFGIDRVHLWAYESLADTLPDFSWLTKHTPAELDKSILSQMWWQYKHLPREVKQSGSVVLFNTDAGSVCPFQPSVTLSQDMLSYEPGEMSRFGIGRARLRLSMLRLIQNRSLKNAELPMFLTNYASQVIQEATGPLARHVVVPHGVGEEFRQTPDRRALPIERNAEIRILYISNTALYKHQWNVVRAVGAIRRKGVNASLLLIGGGSGRAQRLLDNEIAATDPEREFVNQMPFIPNSEIPRFLAGADLFVFASSCENMPITLLEAMASGLAIACSDRGPMPEVLQNGGVYFNPEDPRSIEKSISSIIASSALRDRVSRRASQLSRQYSWERCAAETWQALVECAVKSRAA
jgi:glycosyltransferase involved in cell wall biosynthesis